MSTLLFHGPRARERAVATADEIGRLLASPFGDEGLTAKAARAVVDLMSSMPIGDAVGVVIVGPMDEIPIPGVADTLLKTLEEFPRDVFQPILWAGDIGMVAPTVRSRSLMTWCPGEHNELEAYMDPAEQLCRAALRRKRASVIELLNDHQGSELELLRASVEVLTKKPWPLRSRLILWESLRRVLRVRGAPTRFETLSAYML